jgi:outer membrane lipoprotein-sorting protein
MDTNTNRPLVKILNAAAAAPLSGVIADAIFDLISFRAAVLAAAAHAMLFAASSESAEFRKVQEKIEQAKSLEFTIHSELDSKIAFAARCYVQGDLERLECLTSKGALKEVVIRDYEQFRAFLIDFDGRTFDKVEPDKDIGEELKAKTPHLFSFFRKLDATNLKQGDDRKLLGRTVHVYRLDKINTPLGKGEMREGDGMTVMVDAKTLLPVEMVVDYFDIAEKQKARDVCRDFQWNVELDPQLFAFTPPRGFVAAGVAPPLRLKEPDGPVTRDGRYEVREFTLVVGDSIKQQHGGTLTVQRIDGEALEFAGASGSAPWRARKGDEHSVGNRELIEVLSIDANRGSARLQLRTKVDLSILDAYSF